MIGSARCSRSYGLTHGWIGEQADSSSAANGVTTAMIPRRRCVMLTPALSFGSDHGTRHAGHLIQFTDLAVRVEQYRKRDRCGLEETDRIGGFGLDVDPEQRETGGLVFLVELLEHRHFLPARSAPARPEIDQHDLALQIAQGQIRVAR